MKHLGEIWAEEYARFLDKNNKHEKAFQMLSLAARAGSETAKRRIGRAKNARDMINHEEYMKELSTSPSHSERLHVAMLYRSKGQWKQMHENLKAAAQYGNFQANMLLGNYARDGLFHIRKSDNKALHFYNEALKLAPDTTAKGIIKKQIEALSQLE